MNIAFHINYDIISSFAAKLYNFFYVCYYFVFQYDLSSGQSVITFTNPITNFTENIRVGLFGGVGFSTIFQAIEALFNIDLSITTFDLLFSGGILFILAYGIIKYLIPTS